MADDLLLGLSVTDSAGGMGAGPLAVAQPDNGDEVERAVGVAVAAGVEAANTAPPALMSAMSTSLSTRIDLKGVGVGGTMVALEDGQAQLRSRCRRLCCASSDARPPRATTPSRGANPHPDLVPAILRS